MEYLQDAPFDFLLTKAAARLKVAWGASDRTAWGINTQCC
jgi:hypothetical protein